MGLAEPEDLRNIILCLILAFCPKIGTCKCRQMTEIMEGLAVEESEKDPSQEFSLVKGIWRGNMSRVFLAVHLVTKELYAVKVMRKANLHQRVGAFKLASREKDILSSLNHPFLPSLFKHFESDNHTFLATRYCSGGDMKMLRLLQPNQIFSESATRFYAAEVVLALEYLHKKGIVYRDLKPENILVQDNGHIMLTDFDLSLRLFSDSDNRKESTKLRGSKPSVGDSRSSSSSSEDSSCCCGVGEEFAYARSHSFVGTKEYMAPEILWSTGHAFPVDWWSLGIFLYELVHGRTPFRGANRKETFFNILCQDPFFTGPFSPLQDLIVKLLVKEPSGRLGSLRGAEQVKQHVFFHGLRWDELEFVFRPPFVPSICDNSTSSSSGYDDKSSASDITDLLMQSGNTSDDSHEIECFDLLMRSDNTSDDSHEIECSDHCIPCTAGFDCF